MKVALLLTLASFLFATTPTLAWTTPLVAVRRSTVGISSLTPLAMVPPSATEEKTETDALAAKEESTTGNDDNNKLDPKAKMAQMMQPIKEAGVAGAISLFLWEAAFWIISIPVCSILYYQSTGSWPDWKNAEDVAKVGAEAFAFANIARFALPLRVGLAVTTTPWVQEKIVDKFLKKKDEEESSEA